MTSPVSSATIIAAIADTIAPNTDGAITAELLAAVLDSIAVSYVNIVDGGSLSTVLGTVTTGVWQATPIGLTYGGTGEALSPSNGGLVYSGASGLAILPATATANQLAMSGASGAPAWSTAVYPPVTSINQILWSNANNNVEGLTTANNGVLVTDSSGVPSISSTIPAAAQANITGTGTLTSGSTGTGFTVNATLSTLTGNWPASQLGGTTLAASVVTSSLTTVGIIGTGTWNATTITMGKGGTSAALSPSTGAAVYSSASALALVTPANAGQIALYSPTAAPTMINVPCPVPQGRLTALTGTPVPTSPITAATSVYYTPYVGSCVPLWNGSCFVPTQFSELSNLLSGTTPFYGPTAAAASSVYDLFVWLASGNTVTLTRSQVWSGITSPYGSRLSSVNGVWVNQTTITNGPAAGYGTYVGSIYTDSGGGTVSFNRTNSLNVWNMYNRIPVTGVALDTSSYTYTTATVRQAHGTATGTQVSFLVGLIEDDFDANLNVECKTVAALSASCQVGIGLNTTTVFSSQRGVLFSPAASAADVGSLSAFLSTLPSTLGVNVISSNESGDGANANTFNNNSTNTLSVKFKV